MPVKDITSKEKNQEYIAKLRKAARVTMGDEESKRNKSRGTSTMTPNVGHYGKLTALNIMVNYLHLCDWDRVI
jgi:hypothetical protein